ncbi:MAG: xanthine dehydrogenase family protein subunit M [Caldilineaceae bacterium]|nr:xanthine dehydrogenase family protein subunit M [Caldilineaceae bacterium]
MKPAPFQYFAPVTVDDALALLAEHGYDAKLLAGGQSLVPTMNFRLSQPGVLVDLNKIADLAYIRADSDGTLRIGAMTRQSAVERDPLTARHAPLLAEAMPHIAHRQIRNRGTIGGSLAHADPAAELPAIMVTLNARFVIQGAGRRREVAARDFFQALFMTDLAPDEILTEIIIPPMPPGSGWAMDEIARRHGDYALVGAAALVTMPEGDLCADATLTFLSVGETPVVATLACAYLCDARIDDACIAEAARMAGQEDMDPPGDIHASVAYRRKLAQVLARRVLTRAFQRAKDGVV